MKIKEQKDICIAIQQFQNGANKSVSTASASNIENKIILWCDIVNKIDNQSVVKKD